MRILIFTILSLVYLAGGVFAYRRRHSSRRWYFVSGAIVAGLFAAWLAFGFADSHPESGTGLTSVEWLDSRASDISYLRSKDPGGVFVYEFHITSTDFDALAKERDWHMVPQGGLCSILRYTFFLPETDARRQKPLIADVKKGLFFENRHSNGGGITVLYDTNALRAYVFQSSR